MGSMTTADSASVKQARAYVQKNLYVGVRCPCCDQHAQLYKRKLGRRMVRSLVLMYKHHGTEYQNLSSTVGSQGREEGKLAYWGLIKRAPNRPGWWKVTARGERFVKRQISVPSHVMVYNGRARKMVGKNVTVAQCVGGSDAYKRLIR